MCWCWNTEMACYYQNCSIFFLGEYCEVLKETPCQDGLFGDPNIGICGPCMCDVGMNLSPVCNKTTGECYCKVSTVSSDAVWRRNNNSNFLLRALYVLICRNRKKYIIQLFRERLSEKVHATIPKGIVSGLEFTVLQRNFEKWHERPWTYVWKC